MSKRITYKEMTEESKLWRVGDGQPSEYWFSFHPHDANPPLYWLKDTWSRNQPWVVAYKEKASVPSGRILLDLKIYKKHGYFLFENVNGTIVPIYAYN